MDKPAPSSPRQDGRLEGDLRPVTLERNCSVYAEGSCMASFGMTKVLCAASVEEKVPAFMRGKGSGWVRAEYSLLPRSTETRTPRDISKGRLNGRASEIQRLIGRSLRAAVDLSELGERTIWIDCDVIQADGGTRTAAITGGFVALADSLRYLRRSGAIRSVPLKSFVAAVSVGILDGRVISDLCYSEDKAADVDMNLVMDGNGDFVEVQGAGEKSLFSREELDSMLDLGKASIKKLIALQKETLAMTEEESEFIGTQGDCHRDRQQR